MINNDTAGSVGYPSTGSRNVGVGARSLAQGQQFASNAQDFENREDRQIRQTALAQACHDLKGEGDYEQVLTRARAYYEFLKRG